MRIEFEYNALSELVRYIADPDHDNTWSNGVWTVDTGLGDDEDQVTQYVYADPVFAFLTTEVRYPTGDGTVGSTAADIDGPIKWKFSTIGFSL